METIQPQTSSSWINLVVLLPLFLVAVLAVFIILTKLIFHYQKQTELNKPNFLFLELDLRQWRLKRIPLGWNRIIQKSQLNQELNQIIGTGWMEIAHFFTVIGPEEEQKWKQAIKYCIENHTNAEINSIFKLDQSEHKKTHWQVEFFPAQKDAIRINIKWVNKHHDVEPVKLIKQQELLKERHRFKLFVAFSLTDHNLKAILPAFLHNFSFVVKVKNLHYFSFRNIVVFVAVADYFEHLQKIKAKIAKHLARQKHNLIFNDYYDALTYVEAKDVKDETDLAKILTRISFGIIKSQLNRQAFYFSTKSLFFNEFEEYKAVFNQINQVLVHQNFIIEKLPVYSLNEEKPIINYLIPRVNLANNNWAHFIFQSLNFQEKLNSLFFKQILARPNNEAFMISLHDGEIIKYFDQLKQNKQILYIINLLNYKKPLQIIGLLELLKKHEIQFGLRVAEINSVLFSILENVKPRFLVFSQQFMHQINADAMHHPIDKISLIVICERFGIIPIFENPDENFKMTIKNLSNRDKYYFQLPTWEKEALKTALNEAAETTES